MNPRPIHDSRHGSDGLTVKQRTVLDFIKSTIVAHGYPPTVREICKHIGATSTTAALDHLSALERAGKIRTRSGTHRKIELVGYRVKIELVPIG